MFFYNKKVRPSFSQGRVQFSSGGGKGIRTLVRFRAN